MKFYKHVYLNEIFDFARLDFFLRRTVKKLFHFLWLILQFCTRHAEHMKFYKFPPICPKFAQVIQDPLGHEGYSKVNLKYEISVL